MRSCLIRRGRGRRLRLRLRLRGGPGSWGLSNPLLLLGTLEHLFEPLLLCLGGGLPFALGRLLRLLDLMQRALLLLETAPELRILFLDVEQGLFHDGPLGTNAWHALGFRHSR